MREYILDKRVAEYIINRREELLYLFNISKSDTNPDGTKKYHYDTDEELGKEYHIINEVYNGLDW